MKGVELLTVTNGQIKEVWLYSSNQEAEDAFWGK